MERVGSKKPGQNRNKRSMYGFNGAVGWALKQEVPIFGDPFEKIVPRTA